MATVSECRRKAEEAEALARLVSLNTDKARLADMAAEWRRRAADLEAGGDHTTDACCPATQPKNR